MDKWVHTQTLNLTCSSVHPHLSIIMFHAVNKCLYFAVESKTLSYHSLVLSLGTVTTGRSLKGQTGFQFVELECIYNPHNARLSYVLKNWGHFHSRLVFVTTWEELVSLMFISCLLVWCYINPPNCKSFHSFTVFITQWLLKWRLSWS